MYVLARKILRFGSVVIWGLIVGGALISFGGCDQAPPPPPPPAKIEITEPPSATEEVDSDTEADVPPEPQPTVYEYDPTGRREPFESLIAEEEIDLLDVIATPDPELLKSPLQKVELAQLKITGIILGSFGEYARILSPDGKSYTVNAGTLIGMHEGQVISITSNSVVVKEILRYESGKVEEVESILYLNPIEDEEEERP